MKINHASLIGLLLILVHGYAQGQVISLEANTSGHPAIKLDGRIINDKTVQNQGTTYGKHYKFVWSSSIH